MSQETKLIPYELCIGFAEASNVPLAAVTAQLDVAHDPNAPGVG